MIPYLEDKYQMLQMLACAIKGVYASVFYRDSKAYMTATSNVIDQGKDGCYLAAGCGQRLWYKVLSYHERCAPFAQLLSDR